MAPTSSPYLSFPGNAAQAFPFYRDLFGGTLELQTYDSMPALDGFPFTPPPGSVAHATMTAPGITLAGGDNMGENLPTLESDVYSFLLIYPTEQEARDFLEAVTAAGGEMAMPFERAPWGDLYGQVRDNFGIRWDVSVPAGS